jgi:hypothetical protein
VWLHLAKITVLADTSLLSYIAARSSSGAYANIAQNLPFY